MIEIHLWLIPLGFIGGFIGSIIGLGGGIIIVPVLIISGFNPALAASSSLFATCSNAIASTISYSRVFSIDYKLGLRFALLAIVGTILGAYASTYIQSEEYRILLLILLFISSGYILIGKKLTSAKKLDDRVVLLLSVVISIFAGIISSFFGIGGGIVFMPFLLVAFSFNMNKATAVSQFALVIISISGIIVHSLLGTPELIYGILLALGAFAGGMFGARLAVRIQDKNLRIFGFLVIVSAGLYIIFDSINVKY